METGIKPPPQKKKMGKNRTRNRARARGVKFGRLGELAALYMRPSQFQCKYVGNYR